MLTPDAVDDFKVIDADCHVVEPYDLWTSRVSSKWGDDVPRVVFDEKVQQDVWTIRGESYASAVAPAMAGFDKYPPERPKTLAEAPIATVDVKERLKLMDEYGIWAEVLYPNVGGFGGGAWMNLKDPDLRLACVSAYNDFLIDYAEPAPDRFIANCSIPFWDLPAALKEVKRARELGHRGILFSSHPQNYGAPHIADKHWDPLWALAQDMGMPINFHIGSGGVGDFGVGDYEPNGPNINYVIDSSLLFLTNANAVANVICSGVCERFPQLNFVSVESGVGWIPFLLETLDWQWENAGMPHFKPEAMLPSEIFRRQWYACFWFERGTVASAIEAIGEGHILYETDFPHPTSMAPGPASSSLPPREFISEVFSDFSTETTKKILHDNAAALYNWS
jgi:predicted TIM-barrel fold metal-dependent hydrolase